MFSCSRLELVRMPELGQERLGELHRDEEGYIRDPGDFILGRLDGDDLIWFDGGGSSKLRMKLGDVETVERTTEPHAYHVTSDGETWTYYGCSYKPDVPRLIPERTRNPILDLDAVMEYSCPELRN